MSKTLRAADLFCGAGGTSTGLLRAAQILGRKVELAAVNHWSVAVETHAKNHPDANHFCEDLTTLDPRKAVPSGRLDLLVASPECTHHSVARGGKPMNDQSRASAWCVLRWATALRIDRILIENVREFTTWGPLGTNGRPLKSRRGETFAAFVKALESLGYRVEWRVLNAADYGDATTRQRLFLQAALGRRSIRWPAPTHSADPQPGLFGMLPRWRSARHVLDWSLRGTSIFNRKRPLSPNTMARIEAGLRKFGGAAAEPFLVAMNYMSSREHDYRYARGVDEPIPTITSQGNRFGLVEPCLVNLRGTDPGILAGTARSIDSPIPTLTGGGHLGLVEPFVMHTTHHGGERVADLDQPLPTITGANRGEMALVEPFVVSFKEGIERRVHSVEAPLPTQTTEKQFGIVEPFLLPHRQFEQMDVDSIDVPMRTITATNGGCNAIVQPFIIPQFSGSDPRSVDHPLGAITTTSRGVALVEPTHSRVDILFRMLQPHELAAAMGFPADYQFAGNRGEQVKQIGNAVCVNQAQALCGQLLASGE